MPSPRRVDGSTAGKSMTLRLSPEMTQELELVSRVRGIPVTHVVRLAVARYLAGLAADESFQEKLRDRLEQEQATLARFRADPDVRRAPA